MFALLSSCTIAAPFTINFVNYSGYFPCSPLAASLASDHIPWKCGIWKHEDYHINIHSILTSNIFLIISIQSCESDFWEYLFIFFTSKQPQDCSHSHNLPTFPESTLFQRIFNIFNVTLNLRVWKHKQALSIEIDLGLLRILREVSFTALNPWPT